MKINLSDHFNYKKLFYFVFPSIIMMVFMSIYSVVDGLFISNFVGDIQFAAINFVMPFTMILGGMGFMIGTGGSALVAKELGKNNIEKANKYFSMMIIFTLLFGIILTIIGILSIRQVSLLLGATLEMIDDCVLYGSILIGFTTAFMLQNVFQSFLVTAGKPKLGLTITLLAGITNIILDALFIVVFKWGLMGAAFASGIGQCVGGIIPLIYFFMPNNSLLKLTKTKLEFKPLIKACANGSSELMSNISASIVGMLYNYQLLKLVGHAGIDSYGVLMYVQFIFQAISIGYSIGVAPIVSYNLGSKNHQELQNILKKSLWIVSLSSIFLTLLAQLSAVPLANLFVGYNHSICQMTIHAFRLFSFAFILSGFNIFTSSFFTALNNGSISALISFLRTLIFQVFFVIILPIYFELDGIWLSIPIAEIPAFIISLIFLISKRKKYQYF